MEIRPVFESQQHRFDWAEIGMVGKPHIWCDRGCNQTPMPDGSEWKIVDRTEHPDAPWVPEQHVLIKKVYPEDVGVATR